MLALPRKRPTGLEFCIYVCLGLFSLPAHASRPSVDPNKKIKLVFGSPLRNEKNNQIDKFFVLVRESTTGRIYRAELVETTPDSSIFESLISIPWSDLKAIQPEIFVPPLGLSKKKQGEKQFTKRVLEQKIKRNPILIKIFNNGLQVIDIYKGLQQSHSALKAYKLQLANEKSQIVREKVLNKALPKLSEAELVIKAEKILILKQLRLKAKLNQNSRLKKIQEAKNQLSKWQSAESLLTSKVRKQRHLKAKSVGVSALKKYQAKDYQSAEKLFKQALLLSPNNLDFPFYHSISLYRLGKLDTALVGLSASNVIVSRQAERHYYIGLIHYKLKELTKSSFNFFAARKTQHEIFAVAATFYIGLIFYNEEKYQKSKLLFEEVLDKSMDPKLDDRAELYLDLIARSMSFKRQRVRNLSVNAKSVLLYDSNILTAADNDVTRGTPGLVDDREGFRFNLNGDLRYNLIFNEKRDWSLMAATDWMRSITTGFENAFQRADYWQSTISAPYRWKGVWKSKVYSISFNPQTDYLVMFDVNDERERNVFSSYSMASDLSLVMDQFWLAIYSLKVSREDSFLADSVGVDDGDAIQLSLSTRQNFFLNRSRSRAIIPNAQLVLNDARGDNKTYKRFLLGCTYSAPWGKKWNWNASASVFYLNYDKSEDTREDTNLTLGFEVTRPVANHWLAAFTATNSHNSSTESPNRYNRYTLMTSLRFNWSH